MASTQSTEDIAFLNSGRYLEWSTQETGTASANGVPTDGVSGINVLDEQVVKIGVVPNSSATLDFRIWLEYEGLTGFKVVDGSERSGIDTGWTQQINVSGAQRIYVEVTSIDVGTFDVEIGRAVTLPNTVLRRRRVITDWADLGTGILGESVVYEDGNGNQATLDWDSTASEWVLSSTGGDWVTLEDWSSGTLKTSLWTETNTTGNTPVYNDVNNTVDIPFDSGNAGQYTLEMNIALAYGAACSMEATFNTLTQPSGGDPRISFDIGDLDQDGDDLPLLEVLLSWNDANPDADVAVFTRQEATGTDFNPSNTTSGRATDRLYELVGQVPVLNDQVNQPFFRHYDVTAASLVSEGFVENAFDVNTLTSDRFNFKAVADIFSATFSGGPHNLSIGKIQVKL